MHPPHIRAEALDLIAQGLNDCEVSRRTGIPRGTIRDWRRPTYVPKHTALCPRCWRRTKPIRFTPEDYCELLGLYLGDGCISDGARTQRLRIVLDGKYPRIIGDTYALVGRCFPANRVDRVNAPGCIHLSVYSMHLECAFPQHAPGKKHERRIALEPWQWDLLAAAPWAFLRGCIRSDGCVFINRIDAHRAEPYEYLSYDFSNNSKDIIDCFTAACELAGIHDYRATGNPDGRWHVRINRRESVAKMLEHVGSKS